MRTFTENNIQPINLDWGSKHRFYFECAMVSTCSPVFNRCSDNYDVERELRNATFKGRTFKLAKNIVTFPTIFKDIYVQFGKITLKGGVETKWVRIS